MFRALLPPPPDADPRETLRWVRRLEIHGGFALLLAGFVLWNAGWWHWALFGIGLLSLSPWPGAQAILRRAERDPSILQADPARGRARGRRFAKVAAPAYAVVGAVAGFLLDGWPAALFMGTLMGVSGALGAWWALRRTRA